jgi:hypothetical protein
MCLTVRNNTKIETTKEDIICYKVFRTELYSGRFGLLSPYQGMKYSPNVLYTLEKPLKIDVVWECPIVEEGFHSFVSRESAQMFLNGSEYVRRPVITKCKIPKGAKFVRGIFRVVGVNYESICSDQIIVLQESV